VKKPLLIIFLVLLIDQSIKFWVKTNMYLGQEYHVLGNWFIIHFTENNGMAFGLELSGNYGKLFLSIFRIIAVGGIGWYLTDLVKKKAPTGLIVSMSLIFAGAL
jgi:signal peptidase II